MKKLILMLLAAAMLLCGCAGGGDTEVTSEPTETVAETEAEAMTALDFTVVDGDGNEVKLSDFFGKPIVLNFWASWCGPCKGEMPDFDEAYQKYGKDVQFVMVNLTDGSYETLESAKAFVEESGYSFPVYYDTMSEGAAVYGITSIPRTYFIAADGTLVAYAEQAIDAETLEKGISMIYGEA